MIRNADTEDFVPIVALLWKAKLPTEGMDAILTRFLLWEEDGKVLGCAATELHGEHALLRSVAVREEAQGRGIAAKLSEQALANARAEGAKEAWLLTDSAAGYWARHGFEKASRGVAPKAIAASPEWKVCGSEATLMRRAL